MIVTATMLNLALSFLAAILVFGVYLWENARKYHTVPGNLGIPVIGNVYQCLKNYWHTTYSDFYNYMDKNADKYGGITSFWYCHKVAVVISDPAIVEKIYKHPNLINKSHFFFERVHFFLRNIFTYTKTDEEWKLRRKELVSYLKKSNLDDFRCIFISKSKKAVQMWSKNTDLFNIKPDVTLLFLEAICGTHFGIDVNLIDDISLYNQVYMSGSVIVNNVTNPITGNLSILLGRIPYPRAQTKFQNMIVNEVKNRAKELLNIDSDQKSNMGTAIALRNLIRGTSDADLERELIELLYVASHTTSFTCISALIFLSTNSDLQEKVWQEQQGVFGDSDRDPTYDDVKKMEYLDRFLKETLRFAGPPMSAREASGKVDFGGKIIPEGAIIFTNFQHMKFDPRYWENPMKFDPDRFLNVNIKNVPKSAYGPFGFGLRNCPGMGYANLFLKVFLSTVVRNLKLHSNTKFEDIKFNENLVRDIRGECKMSVEKRLRRMSVDKIVLKKSIV